MLYTNVLDQWFSTLSNNCSGLVGAAELGFEARNQGSGGLLLQRSCGRRRRLLSWVCRNRSRSIGGRRSWTWRRISLTKKEIEIRIDRENEEIEFGGKRENQISDELRRREKHKWTFQ